MCAMIATYDYRGTFFMLFSFPYCFSIQLSIMQTLIFYLSFAFILKIYGFLLRIDQLYVICSIYSLLLLFLGKNVSLNNCLLYLVGYIRQLFDLLNLMLS